MTVHRLRKREREKEVRCGKVITRIDARFTAVYFSNYSCLIYDNHTTRLIKYAFSENKMLIKEKGNIPLRYTTHARLIGCDYMPNYKK